MIYEYFNVAKRLENMDLPKLTAIDLGCGKYESDIAKQIPDLPFLSLTCVDAYKKDLDEAKKKKFVSQKQEFILSDVMDVDGEYDVVISLDVIEHLKKEDGLKFLDKIEKMARVRIVLFLPMEPDDFHRESPDPNNHLQEHISHWREHEFINRKYRTEVISNAHVEIDKETGERLHWNGLWAVKDI